MCKTLSFVSAKGGVGKSILAANFAKILADEGYKVALFETADLNNLDVILNIKSDKKLSYNLDLQSNAKYYEVANNLVLINDEDNIKDADEISIRNFLQTIKNSNKFDYVIFDLQNHNFRVFCESSDNVIVTTTPDPCSLSNSYALIKTLSGFRKDILMFVNFATSESESVFIFESLKKIARKNLIDDFDFNLLGFLPKHKSVALSTKERSLFCDSDPLCSATYALKQSVSRLLVKDGKRALDLKIFGGILASIRKIGNLI